MAHFALDMIGLFYDTLTMASQSTITGKGKTMSTITPTGITELKFDAFVEAEFAIMNKNNTVDEYRHEIKIGECRNERCKITKVVDLSRGDYREFSESLLFDQDWLRGEGGHDSTAKLRNVESFAESTDKEKEVYRASCYRLVVAVQCEGCQTMYVDPQGYSYARYVGM